MKWASSLSMLLMFVGTASAAYVPPISVQSSPPCVDQGVGSSLPTDPMDAQGNDLVGPAPATFTCGPFLFSNFVGVQYIAGAFRALGPGLGTYVLLEVEPFDPTAGWSYSANVTSYYFGGAILPQLNHVMSGSPAVTEHFSNFLGGPYSLTATQNSAAAFLGLFFGGPTVTVQGSDIVGGTISGLDTVFIDTPEPLSFLLVGSGLLSLVLHGRFRHRP